MISRRDFLAAACALFLPQHPKGKVDLKPVSALSPIRFRNIHRHSGSKTANMRIQNENGRLVVQVMDRGRGIPKEKLLAFTASGRMGVGLGGMRERLKQLGGTLNVHCDGNGTAVSAILNVNGQGVQFESQRTVPVTA